MSTAPVKTPALGFSEADREGVALDRLAEPLLWQPGAGQEWLVCKRHRTH
ncbi:hypothetical protein [Arthrobacter sp. UYCu712]